MADWPSNVPRAKIVTVFKLDTPEELGSSAESIATFYADGIPVSISFDLVRENQQGWQIDEIQGTAGSLQWGTSDLIDAVKDQRR